MASRNDGLKTVTRSIPVKSLSSQELDLAFVGNGSPRTFEFCICDNHLDEMSGGRRGKEVMVKILSSEARQKQI